MAQISYIIFVLVLATFLGYVTKELAREKGYNTITAFIAGFFLGLFAIVWYWALDKKAPAQHQATSPGKRQPKKVRS